MKQLRSVEGGINETLITFRSLFLMSDGDFWCTFFVSFFSSSSPFSASLSSSSSVFDAADTSLEMDADDSFLYCLNELLQVFCPTVCFYCFLFLLLE